MDFKKSKTILAGLVFLVVGIWFSLLQLPDQNLHLVFCDVGQGDAVLISYHSNQILIDGGPNDKVLTCLSEHLPFWDRTLEMVILTHPQADHFTGLINVIERYNVSQFVINSLVNDSTGFWEFRKVVLAEGAPVYSPKAGDVIKVDQLNFLVLWPAQKLGDSLVWDKNQSSSVLGATAFSGDFNETSISLQLSYGNFKALFPGDLTSKNENELTLSPVEVLKVSHHGSKYATGEDFLQKISPQLAVISVGKNIFGHPTQDVLTRLKIIGTKILRTDEKGEIEVVTDGNEWQIKKPAE